MILATCHVGSCPVHVQLEDSPDRSVRAEQLITWAIIGARDQDISQLPISIQPRLLVDTGLHGTKVGGCLPLITAVSSSFTSPVRPIILVTRRSSDTTRTSSTLTVITVTCPHWWCWKLMTLTTFVTNVATAGCRSGVCEPPAL